MREEGLLRRGTFFSTDSPMPKKRIMILSASVGSGHMKAADALDKAFRAHPEHRAVQERARDGLLVAYRMQVCTLVREARFPG